jgi:GAF domain-containing protein
VRIAVGRHHRTKRRGDAGRAAGHFEPQADGGLRAVASIHQIIGQLLPANNCFVALHDLQRDTVISYFVDGATAPTPCPSTRYLVQRGDPVPANPAAHAGPPARHPLAPLWSADALDGGVPLCTADRVIGAPVQTSGTVRFSAEDKQLLRFVSAQIAAAIERKRSRACWSTWSAMTR